VPGRRGDRLVSPVIVSHLGRPAGDDRSGAGRLLRART